MPREPRKKSAPRPPPAEEKAKPRAKRGTVVEDLPLWNQASRIGGGLTPLVVSNIIREADGGDVRRLVDLINECRQRDCHLQAVCSVHEETIAALPFQVVLGDPKARKRDQKAAEWAQTVLLASPEFRRALADLTGAYLYGFCVLEIVWERDRAGRIVPSRFRLVHPRRFKFRPEDGRLVLHDVGGQEVDLLGLYPNKFIVCAPRVNGDAPHREGLMRPLVWMSFMRNWSIADWLKTGEMSWKPWRVGKYKKGGGTSTEDREDLETIMRRMTTEFAAVIPDSTEIEITWPSGATQRGSAHAEIVTSLANEMSKAVLGQTETTQASSSSGYAQAKVHDAVRRDLLEARARQIATDITRCLVEPMVRLNYGDGVAVPRFEFVTQDAPDLEKFSKAVAAMRAAGAAIPAAWFYEEAGIPQPQDGEDLLGGGVQGEEPEEPKPGEKPATSPDEPEDGEDEEPATEEEKPPAKDPETE